MIEYLIAYNARLKTKIAKYKKRSGLKFGGTQRINPFKKV